jgi:photosystem II stability/assembly factor-like uncharacterized protein
MALLVGGLLIAGAVAWFSRADDRASPQTAVVGGDLHSLVADPTRSDRLYVGGHEAVSVSEDGGRTWSRIESLDDADAMGWAFLDGAVVVGGHPGLSVSTDGARTFVRSNEGLPATDIHSVGGSGEVLYAASPAAGVLRSSDGGRSWEIISLEAGRSFMGPILVDPVDDQHLVASDMSAGVVESHDGGRTWRSLGGIQGTMWVSWDRRDVRHIVASGMSGAVQTRDGGATWVPLDVPAGVMLVEVSAEDPGRLFAAAHDGSAAELWVSDDGGGTWQRP